MARFCGNCGARLDDDAKVCGRCGTPIEGGARTHLVKIITPEKQRRRKKRIRIAIGLLLMVTVLAAAITVVPQFTGYNGLIRKIMYAYTEYDVDMLVSLSSDIYYYGNANYVESYLKNAVNSTLDYIETSVGHDYRMTYKINETYNMSKRNMAETLDDIAYSYPDFDVSEIQEIVVANVTLSATKGAEEAERELNITMSKEAGKWKLLYID